MIDDSRANRGFGSLMFAAIPGALAGAAILWLIAVTGVIDLTDQLRQERRAAERVGIVVMPKTPIKLTVNESTCLKVRKSYLDGDKATLYVTNICHTDADFAECFIRTLAPDGTVIHADEHYIDNITGIRAGDTMEVPVDITRDDRTVEINVRLASGTN